MAHFAKLDEKNIVQVVIVVKNEVIVDEDGNESEAIGNEFLNSIGLNGRWVQCSYNASFRRMFPGPGYWFDEENDRFLTSPRPFQSWTFNDTTEIWEAPVPMPEDGGLYIWDEDAGDWVAVPNE